MDLDNSDIDRTCVCEGGLIQLNLRGRLGLGGGNNTNFVG